MSEQKINLVVHILKDFFGEDASRVGRHLCLWPNCSVNDINMTKKHESLALFYQHNLITCQKSPRSGLNEFTINIEDVLLCLKYPKFVYTIKHKFGEVGEKIVTTLLEKGKLCASEVLCEIFSANTG